ncbi:MAG TPA: hypothetical protein VI756_31810 [Blastocatellia bacterium]
MRPKLKILSRYGDPGRDATVTKPPSVIDGAFAAEYDGTPEARLAAGFREVS